MFYNKLDNEILNFIQDLKISNQNRFKDKLLDLLDKEVNVSDRQILISDIKLISEKQLLFIKYEYDASEYIGIIVLDITGECRIVISSCSLSSHTSVEDFNRIFSTRYYNHCIIISDFMKDENRLSFNKDIYKYFLNNHKEMIVKNQKLNFVFKFNSDLSDIVLINIINVEKCKELTLSEIKNLADKFCVKSIVK